MYECLYGYTPFVCNDRHDTKLKILKHKQTLKFPDDEHPSAPSPEALDLMMQLLVEKEKRICSKRYELNDFTRKVIGGKPLKFASDKTHRDYKGRFVYPEDAEDIKQHPFFASTEWTTVPHRRPPFVPRVKGWKDTKYFDDEENISDIDSASSTMDDAQLFHAEPVAGIAELDGKGIGDSSQTAKLGSKASHHHQEDQHIVPSGAMHLNGNLAATTPLTGQRAAPYYPDAVQWKTEQLHLDSIHSLPSPLTVPTKKRKDKKRPRDKILRDPITGPVAMKMRKEGAFMGYAYRRPKAAEEVIRDVIEAEQRVVSDVQESVGMRPFSPAVNDYVHEKRVFLESGGKMVKAGC